MQGIESLSPGPVWRNFAMLSEVPRGSGNERAVMERITRWARERGLPTRRDAVGNLLFSIPPSKGREGNAPILLQAHVDMVCEKNAATVHDFEKDPIRPTIDGDWVCAAGTTLGADNGIGVSMAMALAEDPAVTHGPIEALLTVDEETGLTGAAGVQPGFFTARRMINLDSEEDTGIFVGCAGGRDSILTLRAGREQVRADATVRRIFVSGLRGGHSGTEIDRNRGNAIKVLARALMATAPMPIQLASIQGGSKRNAIAREASAVAILPGNEGVGFDERIRASIDRIRREELTGIDDGLAIAIEPAPAPVASFSLKGTRQILHLIGAIPHGVAAMSQSIPGLVETSTNLGVVETVEDSVRIHCCSRSSVMAALDAIALQHRCIAALAGSEIEQPPGYPGWKPNMKSELLAVARAAYEREFGREPEIKAIHAGLEAGLLTEKYPDLDIISFGPDITGPHSPDERVRIASVQKIWSLLVSILREVH
jgi:dipeptidase D